MMKLSILGCTLKVHSLVQETTNLLAFDCEITPEIQSIHIWNLENNSGTWINYKKFVSKYFIFERAQDQHFLVGSRHCVWISRFWFQMTYGCLLLKTWSKEALRDKSFSFVEIYINRWHKLILIIADRTHYFRYFICITLILPLCNSSTLCIMFIYETWPWV